MKACTTVFYFVWNCFADEQHVCPFEVDRDSISLRCLQESEKEMLREMRARALFPAERYQQVPVGTQIIRKRPCRQTTTGSLDSFKF